MYRLLLIITALYCHTATSKERNFETDILKEEFQITDKSQSDYPLNEILQGCAKTDCIPSIDEPRFISVKEVDFLKDDDLVLALRHNGQFRVYPAMTLQKHEIVNDTLGGDPVAVTYCPLCGTGVAFSRVVNGKVVEFGVSGLLHGSDLVMYDRDSKSLWQQITGRSFAGKNRGTELKRLPLTMTEWGTWSKKHPYSQVLENSKDQLKDHYQAYRNNNDVKYGGVTDPRLNPKRVVYGVVVDGQSVAFDLKLIQTQKKFIHEIKGQQIQIQHHKDGTVRFYNKSTGEDVFAQRAYWFAWFTFHPNTLLFKQQNI